MSNLNKSLVNVKPRNFDFSEGYAETWEIALELTESEEENEEFVPMMNYIYPLGDTEWFERDMQNKFGSDWRKKVKSRLSNTTLIYMIEDEKYYLALTGGGMDLSWEICESYINLGYNPPTHFCNLPRMADMDYNSVKNKRTINACKESLDAVRHQTSYTYDALNEMLPKKAKKPVAVKKYKRKRSVVRQHRRTKPKKR